MTHIKNPLNEHRQKATRRRKVVGLRAVVSGFGTVDPSMSRAEVLDHGLQVFEAVPRRKVAARKIRWAKTKSRWPQDADSRRGESRQGADQPGGSRLRAQPCRPACRVGNGRRGRVIDAGFPWRARSSTTSHRWRRRSKRLPSPAKAANAGRRNAAAGFRGTRTDWSKCQTVRTARTCLRVLQRCVAACLGRQRPRTGQRAASQAGRRDSRGVTA